MPLSRYRIARQYLSVIEFVKTMTLYTKKNACIP